MHLLHQATASMHRDAASSSTGKKETGDVSRGTIQRRGGTRGRKVEEGQVEPEAGRRIEVTLCLYEG